MSDLVVQQPTSPSERTRLVLMFHGIGADPANLVPLGQALAQSLPDAWIVSVQSPFASDLRKGWQWFSINGITEESRPGRIAAVMPLFKETVLGWQQRTGIPAHRTALIGFSQGSNMALASTQEQPMLARQVFSIAGRFAMPPTRGHQDQCVHLLHGDRDPIMATSHSVEGAAQLWALDLKVTLDVFPDLAHAIDGRVVDKIRGYLNDA